MMQRLSFFAIALIASVVNLQSPHVFADEIGEMDSLLQNYCVRCHGGEQVEASIDLSGSYNQIDLLKKKDVWRRVLQQLEQELMPPEGPYPTVEEYQSLINRIRSQVEEVDWQKFHNPGRTGLARLTTVEYRNSIRDIFGVDLQAGMFLGNDPEGSTGFTNDEESLNFPLFAFDNYFKEAERVVDAYLGYGSAPFEQKVDLVAAWKSSSDRSVQLTDDGNAVLLKEVNAPFQVNLDMPEAGMYEIVIAARTVNGEPISAMHFMLNGQSIERIVITGEQTQRYSVIVNLAAGANVVSLGFDPNRAPILQTIQPLREVPKSIADLVRKPRVKEFPLPKRLEGNIQAQRSWKKLNNTIRAFVLTQRIADHLVTTNQVDFEHHKFVNGASAQIGSFTTSKVPFNLAAGSVAVFAEIPQAKLEQQINDVTGFSHAEYRKSVAALKEAWRNRYPERVRKTPGRIALEEIVLSSHALLDTDKNPSDILYGASLSSTTTRDLIQRLATRAYGRDACPDELKRLFTIYEQTRKETDSHEDALHDALVGLLVSPQFLIRYVEPNPKHAATIRQVDLSKRLASFLWLSIPDDTLRSLAANESLIEPNILKSSVDRLIDSPKFDSMTKVFVEQWLDLESLSRLEQSRQIGTHQLLAMREEPILLFQNVFRDNASLLELIDADYTFLNDSLALHYGINGVLGQKMRRVKLSSEERGGLLAMGAILTSTSTPQRTSPVTRGAFIVELLLGKELPPPPPNVPELVTDNKARTVREELEQHRRSTACAGCHNRIDPFGFVLEHYDQWGVWRDKDKGRPVSAATELVDGTKFHGLDEFKAYLTEKRRDDFIRNITERLFEFALGRKAKFSDEAMLRHIVSELERNEFKARTLIYEIVKSEAFQQQID